MIAIVLFIAGTAVGAGIAFGVSRRRHFTRYTPRAPVSTWRTIAVPTVNGTLPREALEAAAHISKALGARVAVLTVLQVPRTLSLDAAGVPGLESALTAAEAAERVVRAHGARVHSEVLRVREIRDVLERAHAEVGADVVVVEPNATSRAARELVQTFAETARRCPYDVLLVGTSGQRGPSALSEASVSGASH